MGIAYRPEIDGLRAIAVLSVVLYHAGVGRAGFVGVDVFFVISGYLITSLLLNEWKLTQSIDLVAFYARRVRRILPALVVVVIATVAAAAYLLPNAEILHAANSAGAAMAFVANVFFQSTTGSYFDGKAEEMPLLHLWSLSVEEQFYLFWPLFLLVLLRNRHGWIREFILGVGIASLVVAQALVIQDPESAFYQMVPRLWELAAGGLIATTSTKARSEWLLPVGAVLMGASIVVAFDPFPASGALPVVVGTCLVICAVHGGERNKVLASKPLVGLGLISYSLYLWHWPFLALYRATTIGEGNTETRLALCVVAAVLAAATFRYVEQPFRRGSGRSLATFITGVTTALILAVAAITFGAVPRLKDDHPLAAMTEIDTPPEVCHMKTLDPPKVKCVPLKSSNVGIWGDSMAFSWTPAVWSADQDAIAFTRDACAPVMDYLPETAFQADRDCRTYNSDVITHVMGLDTLVLAAYWQPDDPRFVGLRRTLDLVAPKVGQVILLGPTPTMKEEVPKCLRQDDVAACAISRMEFDAHAKPILSSLRRIAASHPNVSVVDLSEYFCNAAECPAMRDGIPLYWDSHHISMTISRTFDFTAADLRESHARKMKVETGD